MQVAIKHVSNSRFVQSSTSFGGLSQGSLQYPCTTMATGFSSYALPGVAQLAILFFNALLSNEQLGILFLKLDTLFSKQNLMLY